MHTTNFTIRSITKPLPRDDQLSICDDSSLIMVSRSGLLASSTSCGLVEKYAGIRMMSPLSNSRLIYNHVGSNVNANGPNTRNINQPKCIFSNNYSTWKATREALRSLKPVAWTTQILIHKRKRKETGGETNISMCNSSASTYTINSKSSIHTQISLIVNSYRILLFTSKYRNLSDA